MDVRMRIAEEAEELERRWAHDPRWAGVMRSYTRGGRDPSPRLPPHRNTRWPDTGRSGSGICCTRRSTWPPSGVSPVGKRSSA